MSKKPTLFSLFLLGPTLMAAEPTLKEQLEARSDQAAEQIPAEIREEFAKGIDAVAESGILDQAKKVGDKAPDFTLKNATGEEVQLKTLLAEGPVVLTWYRGGWCPYCNIAMAAMQRELPKIKAAGAQLVALSPELPDKTLSTSEKNKLEFEVLTDLNHEVAKDYGLVFKLTPEVRDLYKGFFDIHEFNGKDAGDDTLPLAATYIIGRDGKIQWAFLDADYRKRAEPSEVVAFLEEMDD
ncbi:MAG: peroxiredoxin-like family protein [Verrucomicrobiota bacterium]